MEEAVSLCRTHYGLLRVHDVVVSASYAVIGRWREQYDELDHERADELLGQLQIAQLAAEGLTNRDIGARLYLSPRTIGFHLHKIFPKLGIISRAQLRDSLESMPRLD